MKQKEVSTTSLYSLASELKTILDDLADSGGEFSENQERALLTASGLIKEKTDAVCSWVKSQEDLLTLVSIRMKELSEIKQRIDARLNQFDKYTLNCMALMNTQKIEGEFYAIKKRKPSQVVIIEDESLIPIDFVKIPEPKPEIMKSEIAKALKEKKEVPGARLAESTNISLTYGPK